MSDIDKVRSVFGLGPGAKLSDLNDVYDRLLTAWDPDALRTQASGLGAAEKLAEIESAYLQLLPLLAAPRPPVVPELSSNDREPDPDPSVVETIPPTLRDAPSTGGRHAVKEPVRAKHGAGTWLGLGIALVLGLVWLTNEEGVAPTRREASSPPSGADDRLSPEQLLRDAYDEGVRLLESGKPEEAIPYLLAVATGYPAAPWPKVDLAAAHFRTGDHAEAESLAREAIDLPGAAGDAALLDYGNRVLGYSALARGSNSMAARYFEQALDAVPDSTDAREGLRVARAARRAHQRTQAAPVRTPLVESTHEDPPTAPPPSQPGYGSSGADGVLSQFRMSPTIVLKDGRLISGVLQKYDKGMAHIVIKKESGRKMLVSYPESEVNKEATERAQHPDH